MGLNLLLVVCCTMMCSFVSGQTIDVYATSDIVFDSTGFKKEKISRKNVVRLYPNPSYGKISVTANTSEPLNFYIFDLEGTLVYQTVLTHKERKNIENLKKGTYMYDVFEKDQSIEDGKIIVR